MAGVKRGGGGREADRQNTTVMSLNTITNSKYINNVIIHLCMYESWNEMWHLHLEDISTDNCVNACSGLSSATLRIVMYSKSLSIMLDSSDSYLKAYTLHGKSMLSTFTTSAYPLPSPGIRPGSELSGICSEKLI